MQEQKLINFQKERDLGEVLSDTFTFIRQNYKSLFKVIYKVVGPVMLVMLLSYFAYNYFVFKGSAGLFTPEFDQHLEQITSKFAVTFFLAIIFILAISVLFYAIFYAAINFAILSYIENKGEINVGEVADKVKEQWMNFFSLAFVAGVMVIFGVMLCFVPGVYLFVPMSLVFSIMIFRQQGVLDSISYSFKLIKSSWWMSFLILFLMLIIYYVGASFFQIPAFIYTLIKTMTFVQTNADMSSLSDIYNWPYMLLSLLGSLAQFVLYVFFIVSTVFLYFSLDEKRNRTGAFETIENLGREE